MTEVATHMGLQAQFFSTPTSLTAGFGSPQDQQVRLVRSDPGNVDLSKLLDLDRVADDVAQGTLSIDEGLAEIQAIDQRPALYRGMVIVGAFGLAAAGSSRFFGAGLNEIAAAAGAGLIAGSLAVAIPRAPRAARLFELTAAFCVTVWVAVLQAAGFAVAPFVVILAGLIVLVPGLTLTVAVSELATQNLVSGSARLTFAGMSLLQIALGVAFGQQVSLHIFGPLVDHAPMALAPWTEVVSLVATSLAISMLFQAPAWLMPIIVGVTSMAIVGARVGGWLFTPQLGASLGALFVAMLGNLYARWKNRPAVVLIVPGMMVLVPGSVGFRSVNSLMKHDVSMGLETAFNMGLIAVAIVAGLLIANVVLPPKTGRESQGAL